MTTLPLQYEYSNMTWFGLPCTKLLEGAEGILGLPAFVSDLCLGSVRAGIFLGSVSDNLCRCGLWGSAAWTTLFTAADVYSS